MPYVVATESSLATYPTEEEKDAMVARLQAAGIPYRVEEITPYYPGKFMRCQTHDRMFTGDEDGAYGLAVHLLTAPGPHEMEEGETDGWVKSVKKSKTLMRRPDVRVRSHLRRRVLNHLKNPPKSCLCHKSKTVNRIRLGLIRRLE